MLLTGFKTLSIGIVFKELRSARLCRAVVPTPLQEVMYFCFRSKWDTTSFVAAIAVQVHWFIRTLSRFDFAERTGSNRKRHHPMRGKAPRVERRRGYAERCVNRSTVKSD